MAQIKDPAQFIGGYEVLAGAPSAAMSGFAITKSGINSGLVDTSDIKEVLYSLLEQVTDFYSGDTPRVNSTGVMTAAERSAAMVISRSSTMASDSQMRKSFTVTFLLDVGALPVTDTI